MKFSTQQEETKDLIEWIRKNEWDEKVWQFEVAYKKSEWEKYLINLVNIRKECDVIDTLTIKIRSFFKNASMHEMAVDISRDFKFKYLFYHN